MLRRPFHLTSQITVVLLAITAIAAALIVSVALLAANKVDHLALGRQHDFVDSYLQESIKALSKEQSSVTIWDDAVFYTRARDLQWMTDNYGSWLYSYFRHDLGYVIDADDNIVFAARGGQRSSLADFADEKQDIMRLVGTFRREMKASRNASTDTRPEASLTQLMMIDGRPTIVSARPILPNTGKTGVLHGSEFIHVAARFVDGSLLSFISSHARVENLHYAAGPDIGVEAAVSVGNPNASPLGYLSWKPIEPGFMVIQQIAPAALLGFGIAVGTVFLLGFDLRNTSRRLLTSKLELMRHRNELEETVRLRTAEIERQATELDRMLKQERQVNALQRQFVAMASHEFRTPLAVIDAAAQRLLRQKETPTSAYIAEKVDQIRHSVARMVDLMESILSAGRLSGGIDGIQRADVDIPNLVESCCRRQGEIRNSHRFHLEFDGFPQLVSADARALEQVFINLIANAVKYAPAAPDIFIRGRQENGTVCISIQDFGIGMDADDLPKLFQPYFRARSSTGITGTGIGLNLAKQIVELHGGAINVESELGRGTTFTITLPLNAEADSPQTEKSREAA